FRDGLAEIVESFVGRNSWVTPRRHVSISSGDLVPPGALDLGGVVGRLFFHALDEAARDLRPSVDRKLECAFEDVSGLLSHAHRLPRPRGYVTSRREIGRAHV